MKRFKPQATLPTSIDARRSIPAIEAASPRVEITARHQLDPLRQGQLDGLCSLYAIINGLRLACAGTVSITRRKNKDLFALGLAFLGRKGELHEVVAEGLRRRRRQALAHHLAQAISCSGRQVTIERPDKAERSSLEDVFHWITASLNQNKPVLIPLMGALNHLTVVWGISEERLFLFDSGGRHHVRTSRCDLKGSYHQIQAKGLMRIAVSPQI